MEGNEFGGDLAAEMDAIGAAARAAARRLGTATSDSKITALREAAAAIRAAETDILAANRRDLEAAQERTLSAAMLDRLALDASRIEAMARGLEDVAALPEPVGKILAEWTRPNGLRFQRLSVPLGVIILRGGSESFHSSAAIAACLRRGLAAAGLPEAAIQLVPTRDRDAVGLMLAMAEHIDVIVPRGGKSLIERVQRESRIPVLAHLEGLCHVYVDSAADLGKARAIVLNAKMRRTGVCGAAETLLIDRAIAATHLPPILADLRKAGCSLRGDAATRALDPAVEKASEADWTTEYLDAILSVRVVDGIDGAIAHINRYGSHHTDAIVSEDMAATERFLAEIDSAIVLVNASTQFADGGEFGMGAEIGISTGRLHARGPVGAEQLTTYKYVVRGDGQVRP